MTVAQTHWKTESYITNWEEFDEKVRSLGYPLLKRLDDFPHSVLVTGCQRSGTTMLTRLIAQSDNMVNYWFGPDDELDAALLLSGYVEHTPIGRYCFQTTYINNHQHEYYEHTRGHKLIFMLRNPFSVIYSMLNNWPQLALNRIFRFCGVAQLRGINKCLYTMFGTHGISRLYRACYAYNGKVTQVLELKQNLSPDQLMIIDYDELVMQKVKILPLIYAFIDLPYKKEYAAKIHAKSVSKIQQLSRFEVATINARCEPVYRDVMKLRTTI